MINKLERRDFLKIFGTTGAGLILGFNLSCGERTSETVIYHTINAFLKIGSDHRIVILAKNPEIGQGVKTALPMIIAEELDVSWDQVEVRQAGYNDQLGGQWAGGSMSVKSNWETLRQAGAAARDMLRRAAAAHWGIEKDQVTTARGKLINTTTRAELPYGDLAQAAALLQVPEKPDLKDPKDFTLIGSAQRNVDNEAIVTGKVLFGIDVRPEDARVAAIVKCPVFGGTVRSYDPADALAIPGVEAVIEVEPAGRLTSRRAGVAVIARDTWTAFKGKKALKVEWDYGEGIQESTEALLGQMHDKTDSKGEIELRNDGNVSRAFAAAAQILEATYIVPFLPHAAMEPHNYCARVAADRVECWGPTQVPGGIGGSAVEQLTGIAKDKVLLHQQRNGGGFGRRLFADNAVEALYLSQKTGKPIQVVWTREDDFKHDYYRPMGMYKLRGGLDRNGTITAWQIRAATTSRYLYRGDNQSPHVTEIFPDGFPAGFIPNFRMEYSPVKTAVSTGAWRAPGHNATCFVDQSFLDELALAADRDPIEYRLEMLGEEDQIMPYADHGGPEYSTGRLKAVIRRVAALSDWQNPKTGVYRGFAAHFMFGAYVAEVVEISLTDQNDFKMDKVYAAVDCGIVVNELGARAQIEGGIIDGLNATLYGGINIRDGAALQSNYDSYPMLRLSECPDIEIELIESLEHPEGLGEISLPPVSAALCNAIYRATGKRIRELPVRKKNLVD